MRLILVGTHLLAFLAGVCACYRIPRYLVKLLENTDPNDLSEGAHVEPTPESESRSRFSIGVVILVASLFVLMIGIFVIIENRDNAREEREDDLQQVCIEEWAGELRDALDQRLRVNSVLRDAEAARDSAIDDVFDVVILGQAQPEGTEPSPELVAQFDQALDNYVEARKDLEEAREDVSTTSKPSPYPVLNLNCTPKEGS